jgi:hypothetical protein
MLNFFEFFSPFFEQNRITAQCYLHAHRIRMGLEWTPHALPSLLALAEICTIEGIRKTFQLDANPAFLSHFTLCRPVIVPSWWLAV